MTTYSKVPDNRTAARVPLSCAKILGVAAILVLGTPALAQQQGSSTNPVLIQKGNDYGAVNIARFQALLPPTSKKVIEDVAIIHRPAASVRVFRLYGSAPQHYHNKSDAFLYILRGRARFQIADAAPVEAGAGDMLFWAAGTMHGNPVVMDGPVDVLVFDVGPRDKNDTHWANPATAPDRFLDD